MCAEFIQKLQDALRNHEEWRQQCLNLIPSENITSPLVRRMLASDFGHRYYWDEPWYGGEKYTEEIERLAIEAAKQLFDANYANVRPLSGHMSLMAVIMGLCQPGDSIAISHFENGGYPLNLQERFPLDIYYFPYGPDKYNMDLDGVRVLLEKVKPKLAILGASLYPFPHPLKEIIKISRKVGTTIVYDGSHVLGLIAGGEFQRPFEEGAQILLGSTHKTFFGPQGGIVLIHDDKDLTEQVDVTLRPPPVLVDNYHHHRIGALAVALTELLAFGKSYAQQVISNAQVLAKALSEQGVPVIGSDRGFTASHQVLLHVADLEEGHRIRKLLEKADIIADSGVRLGSQEVTRRGMQAAEMVKIADFISDILKGADPAKTRKQVHKLVNEFQTIKFCFNE